MEKSMINKRVLLVDDEMELVVEYKKKLSKFFSEVLIAESADKAISLLKSVAIDIVVCDFKMPKMNGKEFFHCVKALYPFTPVLFLTGAAQTAEIQECLEYGVFDIIEKPVAPLLLANKLNAALLNSDLIKMFWDNLEDELNLPNIESFLQQSVMEQLKTINLLNGIIKSKNYVA